MQAGGFSRTLATLRNITCTPYAFRISIQCIGKLDSRQLGCVSLGKLSQLSGPWFLICTIRIRMLSVVRIKWPDAFKVVLV